MQSEFIRILWMSILIAIFYIYPTYFVGSRQRRDHVASQMVSTMPLAFPPATVHVHADAHDVAAHSRADDFPDPMISSSQPSGLRSVVEPGLIDLLIPKWRKWEKRKKTRNVLSEKWNKCELCGEEHDWKDVISIKGGHNDKDKMDEYWILATITRKNQQKINFIVRSTFSRSMNAIDSFYVTTSPDIEHVCLSTTMIYSSKRIFRSFSLLYTLWLWLRCTFAIIEIHYMPNERNDCTEKRNNIYGPLTRRQSSLRMNCQTEEGDGNEGDEEQRTHSIVRSRSYSFHLHHENAPKSDRCVFDAGLHLLMAKNEYWDD